MKPVLIPGGRHQDHRGCVTYNNSINLHEIKRMYTVENSELDFIRGWQGHKVEQRWMTAIKGSFEIDVLDINFFEEKKSEIVPTKYTLISKKMDILHIPPGYLTSIKCLTLDSKLLLMSDFMLGDVNDEIRYPL